MYGHRNVGMYGHRNVIPTHVCMDIETEHVVKSTYVCHVCMDIETEHVVKSVSLRTFHFTLKGGERDFLRGQGGDITPSGVVKQEKQQMGHDC